MNRREWRQQTRSSRAAAALLAVGLSIATLVLLAGRSVRSGASSDTSHGVLLILPPLRPSLSSESPKTPSAMLRGPVRRERVARPAAASRREPEPAPRSGPPQPFAEALAASAAASAPLKLDEQTIRRAIAGVSPPSATTLASRGGATLGSEPRGRMQAFGDAVAQAAKPDCLAPNEGGSLLSIHHRLAGHAGHLQVATPTRSIGSDLPDNRLA